MKAKVLLTGEIVDVEFFEQRGTAMTNVYIEIGIGRIFYEYELEFITEQLLDDLTKELLDEEKHWQDLRERAAIAAMQGILSNAGLVDGQYEYRITVEKSALAYADELVKHLKGE